MLAVRGVSLGVRASEIVVRDRPRAGGVPPRPHADRAARARWPMRGSSARTSAA